MDADLNFRLARPGDARAVLRLYRSCIGLPGCTWDEAYPADTNIAEDIVLRALYCLYSGDELIGAGFIGRTSDADDIDALAPPAVNWNPCRKPCELARICIAPSHQGRGLGEKLVKALMTAARGRGYDYVRLLVSTTNPRAQAMYMRAGFTPCGRAHMYGGDYFCMQATLSYFARRASQYQG